MKLVTNTVRNDLKKENSWVHILTHFTFSCCSCCLTSQNTDCFLLAGSAAWDFLLPFAILYSQYSITPRYWPILIWTKLGGGGMQGERPTTQQAPFMYIGLQDISEQKSHTHTQNRRKKLLTYKIVTCCLWYIYIPFCLNILFFKS